MNSQENNIKEGSIMFAIDKNKVQYSGDTTIPLFMLNPNGGSVAMIKDNDNKLKLVHNSQESGMTKIEIDISNLSSNQKHVFAATWSFSNKKMVIYIDGTEVSRTSMHFWEKNG